MIDLTENIVWDENKVFDLQTDGCKEFINDAIATSEKTINYDDSNRPFEYVTQMGGYDIVQTQLWTEPAPSCLISGVEISVRERN